MPERSLRIVGADTTFFNKINSTINKVLIPTKIGINSMLISIKRNSLIHTFEQYINASEDKKEECENKYNSAYEVYLETLDKYVMDSIYKKIKNGTANDFERTAVTQYYGIVMLKETQYNQYKYKKQKYLIDLDYENVKLANKEKIVSKYKQFYLNKVDSLYKALLKTFSITIANNSDFVSQDATYKKIFETISDYIVNIIPLKIEENPEFSKQIPEYKLYEKYLVGKLDSKEVIGKNILELAISRKIFTHSIPLAVAEKCYEYLLANIRQLLQDTKIIVRREKIYNILLTLIEEYKVGLLSNKVYWDNKDKKNYFKNFVETYKKIYKLKESNFVEYIKQKEILFLKYELEDIKYEKVLDYTRLTKYYKRKLIDYGVVKEIKNSCKSFGKYIKV